MVGLNQILRRRGFRRYRSVWNRPISGFVEVVDLSRAKSGDLVTMECGIFEPGLFHDVTGSAPPKIIIPEICAIRARVGELINGRDKWWSEVDIDTQASIDCEQIIFPFLERVRSYEAIAEYLQQKDVINKRYPLPILYLSSAMARLGDIPQACCILDEISKKTSEAWRLQVVQCAGRIGCLLQ